MEITHNSRNVLTVSMGDIGNGWSKWFLLSSDHHFDSPECDRKLMFEHLDMAVERDAHILGFGDFFSMMEGTYDPRKNYGNLRPEYKEQDYLGVIVRDAAKQIKPYSSRILMLGRGNHDQSILKHNNIDVMNNLIYDLNKEDDTNIQLGGYGGWIRFQFNAGGKRIRRQLYYFHGSGGGGEVTRGVIRTNRIGVYVENADFVCTGHTHDMWMVPIRKLTLNNKGAIKQYNCKYINCGTYNDDYKDGEDGWFVESGKSPRPRGAVWLRFSYKNKTIRDEITLALD